METEVLPTAHDVAARASEIILAAARSAIEQRGDFSLVLAGGSTPADCYTLLAAAQADWRRWHIYFGDERCLDPSDPERNSAMAAARLTDRVPIPAQQVHPIPTERGPQVAANDYRDTIRGQLPFDLVLLGMGEDGHTASLFPGHEHPGEALVVPVHEFPELARGKGVKIIGVDIEAIQRGDHLTAALLTILRRQAEREAGDYGKVKSA